MTTEGSTPLIDTETANYGLLLSAFDCFDMSIAIFDGDGDLKEINKHALRTYGIIDKKAFLDCKPNFFNSPSFSAAFDSTRKSYKDITAKVFFDHDKFSNDFPELSTRRGRSLHYLRIHPIYESSRLKFILVLSTDLSTLKKDREIIHQFRDNRSFMMCTEGISTWTYDITSGRRILDSGSHLFPELATMDEFMHQLHPSDQMMLSKLISLLQSGSKTEGHAIIRIPSKETTGGVIFLETSCMPQIVGDKVTGIFFLTNDVTIRENKLLEITVKDRMLRKQNEKLNNINLLLHSILERMPCLFFVKDADNDFRYTMANTMFCKTIGRSVKQVIGNTDENIPSLKDMFQKIRDNDLLTLSKGYLSINEETLFNGTTQIWSSQKYSFIANNQHRLIIGLSKDVTDIHQAFLDAQIAKKKAEKSENMMRSFLKNISNEIITPFNAILGFAQLALEPSTDEEIDLYRKEIKSNGDALKEIIDCIVDISRIQSGIDTTHKEEFDLTAYFMEIKSKYETKVRTGVEFRIVVPAGKCMVNLDKERLTKIVHRGVMTTIANTYHGYIAIGYELADRGVRLFVEDTGMGLTEEEMETITTNFEKLNNFTESIATSLSICRMLAQAMGGIIDLSSSKGDVSKVWIWLPTITTPIIG